MASVTVNQNFQLSFVESPYAYFLPRDFVFRTFHSSSALPFVSPIGQINASPVTPNNMT